MHWWLIIKTFRPNIQHIYGVDNIESDTISRLPFMLVYKYKPITMKSQFHANNLFAISRDGENIFYHYISWMFKENKKKDLRRVNSKLITYTSYRVSGYSRQYLNNVVYYNRIGTYTCRKVFTDVCYIGTISILTIPLLVDLQKKQGILYFKGLVMQVELYTKPCKIFQRFKREGLLMGVFHPRILQN